MEIGGYFVVFCCFDGCWVEWRFAAGRRGDVDVEVVLQLVVGMGELGLRGVSGG